jgi:hypothetical protein
MQLQPKHRRWSEQDHGLASLVLSFSLLAGLFAVYFALALN